MATFAKSTFNASIYSSFRPTYPCNSFTIYSSSLRQGGFCGLGGRLRFGRITNFDSKGVTPQITQYAQGTDRKTSHGSHFQRPGRTILESSLLDVPEPSAVLSNTADGSELSDFQRVFYSGSHHSNLPASSTIKPVEMRTIMRWRDLLGYLRTWSPLHTFHKLFIPRGPESCRCAVPGRPAA